MTTSPGTIVVIGDLLEDVAIRLDGPIRVGTDATGSIERRRGGSAANTAVAIARAGARARFIGQVGDDATGARLVAELAEEGVDTSMVRRGGVTGAIVVIVDPTGERTMLTDRRACVALDAPDPAWLDGAGHLHLPLYGLDRGPLASTVSSTVAEAHRRGLTVSVDLSSIELLDRWGRRRVADVLAALSPDVVLANADEAVDLDLAPPGAVRVTKRGPGPAEVSVPGAPPVAVPAEAVAAVVDTTGAGDAFAAGFLLTDWRRDPGAACRAGHRVAARWIDASAR